MCGNNLEDYHLGTDIILSLYISNCTIGTSGKCNDFDAKNSIIGMKS